MVDRAISKLDDLLPVMRAWVSDRMQHRHVRLLFRGHGRATWKLEPGVYRETFCTAADNLDLSDVFDPEVARLSTEQHMFQDFRIMSAGLRSGREDDVALYFLQQHYGMPTRLLDWSNNPLVGLYFAVADAKHDTFDGELIGMDAYQLASDQGAPQKGEPDVRGIATSKREYVRAAVDVIAGWKSPCDFKPYAIAVRPDHADTRMSLQRSCFTFHVPGCPRLDPSRLSCIHTIRIPSEAKPNIRAELALLGIDDFSVFGDLEHLTQRLRAAYAR